MARCNAKAGSQLTKSVETLSAAMGKPIITSEDKVIDILKSLLLPDPRGQLFCIVCQKLSGDAGLTCCLIVEEDYTHRKGLLEGILEDAGKVIPEDPPIPATANWYTSFIIMVLCSESLHRNYCRLRYRCHFWIGMSF
jgi:hypothetical protein